MYLKDLLSISVLFSFLPLFFYKLGQSSLVSWDEAWYASIARNILTSGSIWNLKFNGSFFVDQPPGGMWLTAFFFKIFGVSEWSARFGSALLGFLSLIVLFFLGKKLFNWVVGLSSAIGLCSSFWFLHRARSGNLDTPLVFFFLLTLFLALKSAENKKFLPLFGISLGLLVVIKSILPFLILPALVVALWGRGLRPKDFVPALLFVCLTFGVWITSQYMLSPNLARYHFIFSSRHSSLDNNFFESFWLVKKYLFLGLGRWWFWFGVFSAVLSMLLKQRRFYILGSFVFAYLVPFLFSPQVQIWHLIPVHPFLILIFLGLLFVSMEKVIPDLRFKKIAIYLILIFVSGYLSLRQIQLSWVQFINIPAYVSDEAILSREASGYPGKLYVDGDFDPAAHFYSQKNVTKLQAGDLRPLFVQPRGESSLVITNTWRLEKEQIASSSYQLIKQDRDKVLVRVNERED